MHTGRKKASRIVIYLILSFWALTTIYPFVWVIINSFRQKGLIMSDSFSLPLGEAFTLDNYRTAWERSDFKNAYLNSFLISGTVTLCVVVIAGLTGYREFAYAQEAIRLGVSRFLLKPSRMDEIREALQTMTERLDRLQPEGAGAEATDAESAGSFLVRQALAYMEDHKAEKLTLQEVTDACYVSQWHLSKLLNRYTENSFYDILNSLRIKAAKELLTDPSLRIGDIGEMVGYADTAHFARVFKKLVGMSANEYRNHLP